MCEVSDTDVGEAVEREGMKWENKGFVVCCSGGEERAHQARREQLPPRLGTQM